MSAGNPVVALGWKMAAGFAGVLGALLLVGLLLPATWSAEADLVMNAPRERIFPLLNEPRRWDAWSPWDVPFEYEGPSAGPGATRTWDAPALGSGRFTIVESRPPEALAYRVDVDDGALVTEGDFTLEATPDGTRVRWRERGDFGRNPWMAFVALGMSDRQSDELARGLERLSAAVDSAAGAGF